MTLAISIGIISSLIATTIFVIMSELVRKVIFPWYRDLTYRGVRIDGEWEIMDSEDSELERDQNLKFSLVQKAENISGTYSHIVNDLREDYKIVGRIRDLYFMGIATPKSSRQVDSISFLLNIDEDQGLKMTGAVLFRGSPGEVNCLNRISFRWLHY